MPQVPEGPRQQAILRKGDGTIRKTTEAVLPHPVKPVRRFEGQDPRRDKFHRKGGIRHLRPLDLYCLTIIPPEKQAEGKTANLLGD